MLHLYDPTVKAEAPEHNGSGTVEPGRQEPSRLAHSTASQLLFLVESPDALDSRVGTLA